MSAACSWFLLRLRLVGLRLIDMRVLTALDLCIVRWLIATMFVRFVPPY